MPIQLRLVVLKLVVSAAATTALSPPSNNSTLASPGVENRTLISHSLLCVNITFNLMPVPVRALRDDSERLESNETLKPKHSVLISLMAHVETDLDRVRSHP